MITVITPTIRGEEGLKWPRLSLKRQSYKDFEWLIEKHDPNDPPDFNQAMNRMLKKAKGELIVILQDHTHIKTDGLKMFWRAYQENPTIFFTAPLGKVMSLRDTPRWDWRYNLPSSDELNFMQWEIDWAAAPRFALQEIGGFDEELDKQWGFDNVNVGLRAHLAGYRIRNLPQNMAVAYDHDSAMDHPYRKIQDAGFHNERLDQFRKGLKIQYL